MTGRSNRRPVCSVEATHTVVRDADGQWVCRNCATDFIQTFMRDAAEFAGKSEGGVELPSGVKDDRVTESINVAPYMPNRAQRRRMR